MNNSTTQFKFKLTSTMLFSYGSVKVGESLAISIAMRMRRYDARRIARWSTSQASIDATGHHIVAAAVMVDDFGRKHKTLTKDYF